MMIDTLSTPSRSLLRGVGLCLLLTLLIPLLNWELVFSRLIVVGDLLATSRRLIEHSLLFRVGIVVQVAIALGAVVMASVFYVLLKPLSPTLALLAFVFRAIEAALIAVLALLSFIVLQVLDGSSYLGEAARELFAALAGTFLHDYMALWSVSMVFFGLGASLSFYLLLRSGYVPMLLARLGVLSYALVLAIALLTLLAPSCAANPIVQALCYTPSVLFELCAGTWLLVRGASAGARPQLAS